MNIKFYKDNQIELYNKFNQWNKIAGKNAQNIKQNQYMLQILEINNTKENLLKHIQILD